MRTKHALGWGIWWSGYAECLSRRKLRVHLSLWYLTFKNVSPPARQDLVFWGDSVTDG